MWKATFVNQYGVTFTVTENELGTRNASNPTYSPMLEYIRFATENHSILVTLEKVNA
jgi:hypothetical protein